MMVSLLALGLGVPAGPVAADDGTVTVTVRVTDDKGRSTLPYCLASLDGIKDPAVGGFADCGKGVARIRVAPGRYRLFVEVEPPYSGGYYVRSGAKASLTGFTRRSASARKQATVLDLRTDVTLPAVAVHRPGRITGTVKNTAGKVVPFAGGQALTGSGSRRGTSLPPWENGRFTVSDLRTGTYRVGVNRQSGPSVYVGGYYTGKGKKVTTALSKAARVKVTWGKAARVEAKVWTCATVSGRIKGQAGTVKQVTVFNDADKRLVTRSTRKISASGRFTVTGLLPGKYYLSVEHARTTMKWEEFDTWSTFHGTNSTRRPSKPTLTVSSCTKVTGVVVDTDKYFAMRGTPWVYTSRGNRPVPSVSVPVGDTLTGYRGAWTGRGLKYSYQWLRDGKAIAGARSLNRVVTAADAGHAVTLRITVTARNAAGRVVTKSVVSKPTVEVLDP